MPWHAISSHLTIFILAKLPSYSYHIAASKYSYHIFRNSHGPFDCYDSIGSNQERFSELRLEMRSAVIHPIRSIEEIRAKTLAGSILQASLSMEWDCYRLDLHFPVNHINAHSMEDFFQIETGPVLVPNAGPLGDDNWDWKEKKLNFTLSNSFGFGGNCTSLIFARDEA